jgi:uncharacterized protein
LASVKFLAAKMKKPVLLAIIAYQRYVSPYKGFHCAFHAHTGRETCSGYGYRVFARYGTVRGWGLLRRRFGACSAAAQVLQAEAGARKVAASNRQAGFLDYGGCDVPGCDVPDCKLSKAGDVCDCLGNILDIFDIADEAKKRSKKEWDCADWLNALFILALVIGVVLALAWYLKLLPW